MTSIKGTRKEKKRATLEEKQTTKKKKIGLFKAGLMARRAAKEAKKQAHAQQQQKEAEQKAQLLQAQEKTAAIKDTLAAQEEALAHKENVLARDLKQTETHKPSGFFARLFKGVAKTREALTGGIARIILGKKTIDAEVLDGLEELLYTSDIGPETVERLLSAIKERVGRNDTNDPERLSVLLGEEVNKVMNREVPPQNLSGQPPAVILFVGVNGAGKTTTIGKLAQQFTSQGKKVLLAAGDTFRAAAAEQLNGWAERTGVEIFSRPSGSDPSGVIFQAVEQGVAQGVDLILCDTAGRLHTKSNLMEELKKIKRVIGKVIPDAPHETWLVLDANTGQNAILQTREFHQVIDLTGLIVTKLDGTAKGGVVVGIVNEFNIPIRYIGVGEGVEDLRVFEPEEFGKSLFGSVSTDGS